MAVEVIQGEEKTLVIKLRDSAGDPVDLTGKDVCFCVKNKDETTLTLTSTPATGVTVVSPEVLGKVQVDLTAAHTALLDSGEIDFELEIKVGAGDPDIVQFLKGLTVIERVC